MKENYYAVIMAGGGGTRLWPLSRLKKPKQMLRLGTESTLFQMAVNRLDGLFSKNRIFIVTTEEQFQELHKECPQIPTANFILESMPKGTASVVGLAAIVLEKHNPNAIMAVLTADHIIKNISLFHQLLLTGYELANENHLVTLGIKPTYPATGYGYIKQGEVLHSYQGMEAFKVQEFIEKPDHPKAEMMLATGSYTWNSGMFIWRVDSIKEEFRRQMPQLSESLERIATKLGDKYFTKAIKPIWSGIKPQTIDYGIMENAEDVVVLPADDLGWNDMGSWDSLFNIIDGDQNGNINLGANYVGINTKSSLICSDNDNRLIATLGLENIIVIDTGDAILICTRDGAQDIKQMVNLLNEQNKDAYL